MRRAWLLLLSVCLFAALRAEVPVFAYVVCGADGSQTAASFSDVTNYIERLNFVFSQVCIDFRLERYGVLTNESWLSICGSNESQYEALCATTNSTGGLELYFVREIDDCNAFWIPSGIVISQDANWRTVAHEVGHACGLKDIYVDHDGTTLQVTGGSTRERMPQDYGRPDFAVPHANRVKRLLMYGKSSDTKFRISGGDIYGLGRKIRRNETTGVLEIVWDLFNVEVGFWDHGTRAPASE